MPFVLIKNLGGTNRIQHYYSTRMFHRQRRRNHWPLILFALRCCFHYFVFSILLRVHSPRCCVACTAIHSTLTFSRRLYRWLVERKSSSILPVSAAASFPFSGSHIHKFFFLSLSRPGPVIYCSASILTLYSSNYISELVSLFCLPRSTTLCCYCTPLETMNAAGDLSR